MKKKFYPSSILIGKSTYAVELLPFIEEIAGNVTRGYADKETRTITLLSKQNERDLFSTFIHELLHALTYEHDIKLKHKLVYALEGPLADALLRNFFIIPKR